MLLKNWFKNFLKPYDEELRSKAWWMWQHHYSQKTLSFESCKLIVHLCKLIDLDLADSRILYFCSPGIYPQTFHRTPCTEVLISKGVPMKNKGRLELFETSQKKRLFHFLWQPSVIGGNLTMWLSSCTLQKRLSSPAQFGQEENISWTQLKG